MDIIQVNSVKTIEDYIFLLGVLCHSIKNLSDLQAIGEELGLFTLDENEAAKTVQYRADKLLTTVNDLLRVCCQRGNIDFKKLALKYMGKHDKKTKRTKTRDLSKGIDG